MNILLLDNYDSFTYNLVHYLEQLYCEVVVVRNDEPFERAFEKAHGVVLSPGPGLPEESGNLMQVIQRAYGEKSMLGVCLGMQAIAQYAGGKLKNLPAVLHGKQTSMSLANHSSNLYAGLPHQFNVGHYHSWVVERGNLPDDFKATAYSNSGELMSIEHKNLPIYGVQYHPESVLTENGLKILANWLKVVENQA
jgi:anthranilate synthase component 2